jgi:hypothetical protein
VLAAARSDAWVAAATHRAALGVAPPIEYVRQCKDVLMSIAEKKLAQQLI